MPSAITDSGGAVWVSALFGGTALSEYWIALCSHAPGRDTDGTILASLEPTDPAYARQPYLVDGTHWGTNGPFATNLLDIDYGLPGLDWGFITHFVLCTAATDGDVHAYGALRTPQYAQAHHQAILPAGSLVIGLAPFEDIIAI